MINWHKGTWQQGDRVKYYGSKPEAFRDVEPGLYWYSGLGSGTFFRPDGTMLLNCTPQESGREAERLGVRWCYVDSFDNHRCISVRD